MIQARSLAKLNLFLHITGQRSNGYHDLQMIIRFVDWADDMTFRLRKDDQIHLQDNSNLKTYDNIVLKAARTLQQHSGTYLGADITLNKQLPMGAGLGGGSSNAACTLLYLTRLWSLNYRIDQLCELGLKLGADVPIFIHGQSAWIEGIGEQFYPIELKPAWYVIVVPIVAVSTAEIFQHPKLPRSTPRRTERVYDPHTTHNDCEALVLQLHPAIATAHQWLNQFVPARLTGTGSCLFAECDSKMQAQTIAQLAPDGLTVKVVRGVDRLAHVDEKIIS